MPIAGSYIEKKMFELREDKLQMPCSFVQPIHTFYSQEVAIYEGPSQQPRMN